MNLQRMRARGIRLAFGSQYNFGGPTDKYRGLARLRARLAVVYAHHTWRYVDLPRLRALKDRHAGDRRGFIICNGPSLADTDLSLLEDEITFGVNAIYLKFPEMGFAPTYHVVEDNLVAEDRSDDLNQLHDSTRLFPERVAYCLDRSPDAIRFRHCTDPATRRASPYHAYGFSPDLTQFTYPGSTVTFTCMQIAYFVGLREVYLVGADHSYEIPDRYASRDASENYVIESVEADVNHFDPSYFGEGMRWHNPKVHMMEQAYERAKAFYDDHGGKIYNATKGGKLEVFERVDYDSLF